jgi:hypothetical protein
LWLWLRPGPDTAEVSSPRPTTTTLAAPTPAPAPVRPILVTTPETPALPTRSPAPTPVSPLPTALPPEPTLATSGTRRTGVAPSPGSMPTATAIPAPTPAPIPTPSPAAQPATARPVGYPFRLNDRIDVGTPVVGPITLLGARFTTPRPGELELDLDFVCAKGHDQLVSYEATILDEAGQALLTLRGKKGVEEKDKGTAKVRQPLPPGLMDAARSFRVTFTSVPD